MKKLLTITLAILMVLTLVACSSGTAPPLSDINNTKPKENPPASSDSGNNEDSSNDSTKSNDDVTDQPDLSIELLFAQMDGPYMGEFGPAIFSVNVGMLIFPGGSPEEYQQPIASDFIFYKNGVPEEGNQQLREGKVVDLTLPHNERATVYPFIPETYDTIIVYIYGMPDYSDEKGTEYWFEATVNGVKIRSNTLIWNTDGTYEYLDDMPQPSSALKLIHLSQAPSLTVNDPNERGNSNTNINSLFGANAVYKGDWIYYYANRTLYKMRADGTENQALTYGNKNRIERGISVIGDWIVTHSEMYKTDGSMMLPLPIEGLPDKPLHIVGEWIYYAGINRIRIDGTERENIVSGGSEHINIVDDYIYFSKHNEPRSIFRSKLNGDDIQEYALYGDDCYIFIVEGEWIYYMTGFKNIRRRNVNTSEDVILVESTETSNGRVTGYSLEYVTDGEWIYYNYYSRPTGNVSSETVALYKMRTDGTEKTMLIDDYINVTDWNNRQIYSLNIAGDWLFYQTYDSNTPTTWYMVRTDGTNKRLIDTYVQSYTG